MVTENQNSNLQQILKKVSVIQSVLHILEITVGPDGTEAPKPNWAMSMALLFECNHSKSVLISALKLPRKWQCFATICRHGNTSHSWSSVYVTLNLLVFLSNKQNWQNGNQEHIVVDSIKSLIMPQWKHYQWFNWISINVFLVDIFVNCIVWQ